MLFCIFWLSSTITHTCGKNQFTTILCKMYTSWKITGSQFFLYVSLHSLFFCGSFGVFFLQFFKFVSSYHHHHHHLYIIIVFFCFFFRRSCHSRESEMSSKSFRKGELERGYLPCENTNHLFVWKRHRSTVFPSVKSSATYYSFLLLFCFLLLLLLLLLLFFLLPNKQNDNNERKRERKTSKERQQLNQT